MATPAPTPRINDTLMGRFERWALPAMARRLPAWVGPDTLTAVALVGAGLSAAGYLLAGQSLAWLHLASAGLVVHWWGDSLDGTLARVRDIRRERYGYFVDHQCDAISATALLVALGAGPLMRMPLALGILVGILLMMNLVNMVTVARGVFKISFAGAGPTELRLVMIAAHTAVWALGNPSVSLFGRSWTAFDALGLVAVPALGAIYLVSAGLETARIARIDPRPPRP